MVRDYRKFLGEKCVKCESADKRVLCIHHKDRNRDNNDSNNLETLCYNCHRLTHYELHEVIKFNKPEIYETDDGQIEVIFPKPFEEKFVLYLTLLLGYRKDNMLLGRNGKIVGFRCHKQDFEELLKDSKTKSKF